MYIFLINRAQTQTLNIFSGFHFECPAVCWAAKQLQIVFIYGTQLFLWTVWIYLLDVAVPCMYPLFPHPSALITFVVVAFSIFRLQIGKVQTHTQSGLGMRMGLGNWETLSRNGAIVVFDLTGLRTSDSDYAGPESQTHKCKSCR